MEDSPGQRAPYEHRSQHWSVTTTAKPAITLREDVSVLTFPIFTYNHPQTLCLFWDTTKTPCAKAMRSIVHVFFLRWIYQGCLPIWGPADCLFRPGAGPAAEIAPPEEAVAASVGSLGTSGTTTSLNSSWETARMVKESILAC